MTQQNISKELRGIKVAAFMTAPRYESTWCRNMIETALKEAGVPLVVSQGVFYGQCMQRMLEDAIEGGVEVAITIDFDSIFTGDDVKHLLNQMATGKWDALAALQCRRAMPYPLFTCGDDRHIEFQGEPLEVSTAHFGLTGLNLNALAEVERPWFLSCTDSDGGWGEGKTDDDIYFWRAWRDQGLKVFVDPNLNIGHMEEMISMFDEEGNHTFVYPNDWFKENIQNPKIQKANEEAKESCSS